MLKRIIKSFDIMLDPLDEKTSQGAVVVSLVNIGILVFSAYLTATLILRGFESWHTWLAVGLLLVLITSRLSIVRLGTRRVSLFLVCIIWVIINIIFLFFENGLRAPAYVGGIILLIAYVGLLHGVRTLTVITLLSMLTGIAVGFMELQGITLTEPKIPDVRWSMVALLILCPTSAYIMSSAVQNLKRTNALYRDEAEIRRRSEHEILKLNLSLKQAYETTLEGWSRALELRDKETQGHSRRVTELTKIIAQHLNFSEEELRFIQYGALLHDIGKMGVPDDILNKAGKLTSREWNIIRLHPAYAYQLLKDIDYLRPALAIPWAHHENWDGTGYPRMIKGEEIPLPARIFSVVDNWDALTTDRPYRKAWHRKKVIQYIKEQSGSKFDPGIVSLFLDVISKQ